MLTQAQSTSPAIGGNDSITTGTGTDFIVAGAGADTVNASEGLNVVFGDNGVMTLRPDLIGNGVGHVELKTTDPTIGGNDTIQTGASGDFVLGGAGDDQLTLGGGNNVALGDHGFITLRSGDLAISNLVRVESTDTAIGGRDVIVTGDGSDFVVGGADNDRLEAGSGINVVLGDSGIAELTEPSSGSAVIDRISSIAPDTGGDDVIITGADEDLIIGGVGSDTITAGDADNVVVGDNGFIDLRPANSWTVDLVQSTDPALGGDDKITSGTGNDIIIGGFGADDVTAGNGDNVVLGDNGVVDLNVNADASWTVDLVQSTDPTLGGGDTVSTGSGRDLIIGGTGGDTITASAGDNVILGDNGVIDVLVNANGAGAIDLVATTAPEVGGNDHIVAGDDNDLVIAGNGNDFVDAAEGENVVIGDNGSIDLKVNQSAVAAIDLVQSTDPAIGGDDTIITGSARDFVIGGVGNDNITASHGENIVIGDNGVIDLMVNSNSDWTVDLVQSTDPALGGDDVITTGRDRDLTIGGVGNDDINAFDADNVIVGDNGVIDLAVRADATWTIDLVQSTDPTLGGNDTIRTGQDADIVVAGVGNDNVDAGTGNNVVVGDNGSVDLAVNADGTWTPDFVQSTDPTFGGDDIIRTGAGHDLVIAGLGNDTVVAGDGDNVVIGDNGSIDLRVTQGLGEVDLVTTTDPTLGGNDSITTGSGRDLLIGGAANDSITAGDGDNAVLGDNGFIDTLVNDTDAASVDAIRSTDPNVGGNDSIDTGSGRDVVFGGTGEDIISGGAGSDILLGDHGLYDSALPRNQQFVSIFTGATDGGGNDTIHGDAGDDFILGQQGNDTLFGDAGEDDMTGGHNVLFGADGHDIMDGGSEADVMLGDNGTIKRRALTNGDWARYPGPFPDVIRDIVRFDDIDRIAGDDVMLGGDGQDIIYGQRGDDRIDGGAGDDELVGHLGNDTILGGAGRDIVIGDVGVIVRTFNSDGTPHLNTDGSWHRDILLEDIATITGLIDSEQTVNLAQDAFLAEKLLRADLVIATGSLTADGSKMANGGRWNTDLLLVNLVKANNDNLDGGDGDDVVIGQRGNDSVAGGGGNDLLFADSATNTLPFDTDVPKIQTSVRLLDMAPGANVAVDLPADGTVIHPSVTLYPDELEFGAPNYPLSANEVPTLQSLIAPGVKRSDGGTMVPYLAFVPDVVHHADALPGNDVIDGGDGDDLIFGDDAHFFAPVSSGLNVLDAAVTAATRELSGVLKSLHYLGIDFDQYEQKLGNRAFTGEIRVGNDTITAGAGADVVVGDQGKLITPTMIGLPVPEAQLKNTAVEYYDYLRDLQQLAVDFQYVTLNAQAQVLNRLVDNAVAQNPGRIRPAAPEQPDAQRPHLVIGNDTISGDAGSDTLIGDNGAVFSPFVTSSLVNGGGNDIDSVSKATLRKVQAALKSEQRVRDNELEAHLKRDHIGRDLDSLRKRFPKGEDLRLIAPDYEFARTIGNDTINGGAGNDMVVGDFGLIYVPTILDTQANRKMSPKAIGDEFARLNAGLDTVFGGRQQSGKFPFSDRNVFERNSSQSIQGRGGLGRVSELTTGNDVISGDEGNDLLMGDDAVLAMPFSFKDPSTQTGIWTSKFDVKGLIRDFGHALPGQALDKPVTAITSNIAPNSDPRVTGSQGFDEVSGGEGDDVLLGSNSDQLTDSQGANYLETADRDRSNAHIKDGADASLKATIRKFLLSLASDPLGLKRTGGKDGRVSRD